MKCDRCENEATVHETTRRNGVTVEKHLCETCAREKGLATSAQGAVQELLQQFAVAHAALSSHTTTGPQSRQSSCPACGLTFAEFKQGGMVGCAQCYRAFETQLGPLLERAHEGASRHSGKHPKRLASSSPEKGVPAKMAEERLKALSTLRKQLENAVKAEQYEQAAKLRDQLRAMSDPVSLPRPGATPPPPEPGPTG